MSGTLILRAEPALAPEGAALAVDIVDIARGEERTVALGGESVPFELPEGVYAVRAWLPNGRTETRTVKVTSGDETELTLAPTARNQGLAVAGPPLAVSDAFTFRREVRPPRFAFERGDEAEGSMVRVDAPEPRSNEAHVRVVWVGLWRGDEPIDLDSVASVNTRPRGVALELTLDPGPLALQVGGADVPWHFVCLPPSRDPRVILRAVAPDTGQHDGGVDVRATTSDPHIEALLGYLETGQLEQAGVVGGDVVDAAVQLFQSKVANPEGAAVAGYYLLRIESEDRVHDWPQNFADWFPWLPDAQIIHAWTLLQQPDVPRRELARSRLLEAVRIGIAPRYREGVRLLGQGLRMFAAADRDDQELRQALQTAQAWELACDLSRPVTTYRAALPSQPSPERVLGPPDIKRGILELSLPLEYEPQRQLRPRELEVLQLVGEGLTKEEIAERMAISPRTVRNYLGNSLRLLSMSSADAAAELVKRIEP